MQWLFCAAFGRWALCWSRRAADDERYEANEALTPTKPGGGGKRHAFAAGKEGGGFGSLRSSQHRTPDDPRLFKAEQQPDLVDAEADQPREDGHISEQKCRPAVASRFSRDHRQGAHTLRGEREEDQ